MMDYQQSLIKKGNIVRLVRAMGGISLLRFCGDSGDGGGSKGLRDNFIGLRKDNNRLTPSVGLGYTHHYLATMRSAEERACPRGSNARWAARVRCIKVEIIALR